MFPIHLSRRILKLSVRPDYALLREQSECFLFQFTTTPQRFRVGCLKANRAQLVVSYSIQIDVIDCIILTLLTIRKKKTLTLKSISVKSVRENNDFLEPMRFPRVKVKVSCR